MDNELTFVLSTTELKDAGFKGSFNAFADEIAEMDAIVSGTYDDEGAPVITIVGISREELEDKLIDYGVEDPSGFTDPVEPASVEDIDLDADIEDEDPDDEDEEDEEIEIIDDEDEDLEDEVKSLHDQEEDLHDQEEEIHDQEEEIDPNDDEIEIHDEEEAIHDEEEEIHDDIEDELEESKKHKGTKNISESLMAKIIANVKDICITKRINERLKEIEDMKKNLSESTKPVTIYLNSWSNNKVNGIEIWKYRNNDIVDLLAETKKSYKTVYKKYKTLNESSSKRRDYVSVLKKQRTLIEMLESEYRFRNLNEEEIQDQASGAKDNDESQDDTQEMSLTAIVFKVKDADEFIKVMTDHGIPAEAFKKGAESQDDENNGSDGQQDQDAQQQAAPDAMAAPSPAPAPAPAPAPGSNPFESVTTPLTKKNKLNEDGNPFDQLANPAPQEEATLGDPDQPGATDGVDPLNSDESADLGDGEEVILTDTSYASQVQKVLEDVYGYAKADFEDKIGGEIVGEDEDGSDDNPFNKESLSDGSENDSDSEDEGTAKGDADKGYEDTISPEDIFGDL